MTRDDDLEAAIAAYRSELEAGIALGTADLDEVEDHLRSLIDDLRAAGRSANVAFVEAVTRLGEPGAIAREYARARPAFGATLSRLRAWSAVALLAPMVFFGIATDQVDFSTVYAGMVLCSIGTLVALARRRTWARAITLGYAAFSVVNCGFFTWYGHDVGFDPRPYLVASLGMLAFVAPWRRGELTPAGWSLVLISAAFPMATTAWFVSQLDPAVTFYRVDPVTATVALITFVLGGAGVMLRARWGSVALAISAAALVVTARSFLPHATVSVQLFTFAAMLGSALALVGAAWLSWRTARGGAGTLRALAA